MGKTISFVKGKGSISHNNRDFIAENVDRNRTAWNVEYIKQPIREAYNQLFGEAIVQRFIASGYFSADSYMRAAPSVASSEPASEAFT